MAAIACATERVRIGALVTPTPRRRIAKLARETVTLDRLSGGRLVLGVGIGGDRHGEFAPFGDSGDPRERARLLDEGLDRLVALWDGEFAPAAGAGAADPDLGGRALAQPAPDAARGPLGRHLPDRPARPRGGRRAGRADARAARGRGRGRSTSS